MSTLQHNGNNIIDPEYNGNNIYEIWYNGLLTFKRTPLAPVSCTVAATGKEGVAHTITWAAGDAWTTNYYPFVQIDGGAITSLTGFESAGNVLSYATTPSVAGTHVYWVVAYNFLLASETGEGAHQSQFSPNSNTDTCEVAVAFTVADSGMAGLYNGTGPQSFTVNTDGSCTGGESWGLPSTVDIGDGYQVYQTPTSQEGTPTGDQERTWLPLTQARSWGCPDAPPFQSRWNRFTLSFRQGTGSVIFTTGVINVQSDSPI